MTLPVLWQAKTTLKPDRVGPLPEALQLQPTILTTAGSSVVHAVWGRQRSKADQSHNSKILHLAPS